MHWWRLLPAAILLAGCADTVAQPTPLPTDSGSLSPAVYLIKPEQVTAPLQPGLHITLSPAELADQRHDQSVIAELTSDGFANAARATYGLKNNAPEAPFTALNSDAVLFSNPAGAHQFFRQEARRIDVSPSGGTITALAEPTSNTDEYAAYASTQPTGNHNTAFIFLARRGRVVVELFAEGDGTQTTADNFAPLVAHQESNLAASPDL